MGAIGASLMKVDCAAQCRVQLPRVVAMDFRAS
jgi:hypothetical protein